MQTKYTTIAKVRAKVTTSLVDDDVNVIIALVSGYIDTFLGFKLATNFSDTAVNLLLDGSGTEALMLPQPVYSFTSVDKVALDNTVVTQLYTQNYPLNASYTSYLMARVGLFTAGIANYRLTGAKIGKFSVDFVTPANHTLEEEITQVATNLAVSMINNGGSILSSSAGELEKSGKITSETIGSYQASYANNSTDFVKLLSTVPTATDILNKYREIAIA